jgi:hypothetical protein
MTHSPPDKMLYEMARRTPSERRFTNKERQILRKFSTNNIIGRRKLVSYKKLGFRAPKSGEFYISGAIPQLYETVNDLTTKFMVVEPDFTEVFEEMT